MWFMIYWKFQCELGSLSSALFTRAKREKLISTVDFPSYNTITYTYIYTLPSGQAHFFLLSTSLPLLFIFINVLPLFSLSRCVLKSTIYCYYDYVLLSAIFSETVRFFVGFLGVPLVWGNVIFCLDSGWLCGFYGNSRASLTDNVHNTAFHERAGGTRDEMWMWMGWLHQPAQTRTQPWWWWFIFIILRRINDHNDMM